MDDRRFDHLTRILATSAPRRIFTCSLAGGALAALLGATAEDAAAKKRRKKKKKSSGCTPSCFNKVCGQDNGCGSKCTVQAGCDSDEACIDGECRANVCIPACTGNHICQPNGNCTCPQGLKECEGQGFLGNCHECCAPSNIVPAPECAGNPRGQYCADYFGELVFRCTCPDKNCGGRCGRCCDNAVCELTQGPRRFCNANLVCACPEGTTHCSNELGCVDTMTNRDACGEFCKNCDPGFSCVNGGCCTNDCIPTRLGQPCCVGRCTDRGSTANPQYVCATE